MQSSILVGGEKFLCLSRISSKNSLKNKRLFLQIYNLFKTKSKQTSRNLNVYCINGDIISCIEIFLLVSKLLYTSKCQSVCNCDYSAHIQDVYLQFLVKIPLTIKHVFYNFFCPYVSR